MNTPQTKMNQTSNQPIDPIAENLRKPFTAATGTRQGKWRYICDGREATDLRVNQWPDLRDQIESKTLSAFNQWPSDLKGICRPLKNRPWKRAYRRLSRRRFLNHLNWRFLLVRTEIGLMWLAHVLKLTLLSLLWIGVFLLALYLGWLLLSSLWQFLFGGPVSSGGGLL